MKLIKNNLEKQGHKIEKLSKELRNTDKRDQFKIKGELIQANLYSIKKGDTVLKCINYYDNEEIEITPRSAYKLSSCFSQACLTI